jgi:putative hemolysin
LEDSIVGPGAEVLGILACITLGALFATVDEAMIALGEHRVRAARDREDADSETAARYLADPASVHLRLLVGRVICQAGAIVLADGLYLGIPGGWGRVLSVALVVFAYAAAVGTATRVSMRRATGVALRLLRYWRPFELLMAPLALPLQGFGKLIDRLFPSRPEDDPQRVTELDVEHLIEQGEEHGSLTGPPAELLKSVIEFQDTVAREIMVPRTRMVAIDIDTPLRAVLDLIVTRGHSRYPVYRDRADRLEGVLYAKDLFRLFQSERGLEGKLEDLVRRPVFFTAESQKIVDLLRQMQARRVHLAIVADEFGGTSGMVTLEDIIEEIVGEIRDEHDFEEVPVRRIGPGRFLARADVSVYDLAEITGLTIPDDAGNFDSLGGLLVDMAGRVPRQGEAIQVGEHEFIVRAADERRVSRVEVVVRDAPPPAAAE